MNLANKLTVVRIILVPFFLIFIAVRDIPYGSFIATFIFVAASITDKLDGYIARSRHQITDFGKFLDPLADKLLVATALICLVEFHAIPSYVAIVIIAREFAVTGLRTIAAAQGIVMASNWWGKIKTALQMTIIITLLVEVNIKDSVYLTNIIYNIDFFKIIFNYIAPVLVNITVIVTVISGVVYFVMNRKVLKIDK